MAATDSLKFYSSNIIQSDLSKWTLSNATVDTNGIATIASGGYMSTTASNIGASEYVKISCVASGDAISSTNNYNSGTNININEVYQVATDSIKKRFRNVGITPYSATLSNGKYTDNTILSMLNQKLNSYTIKIENKTSSSLLIYSLSIYRSQDIDSSQLNDATNTYGLIIPVYTEDPTDAVVGQVWIRGDL